MNSHSVRVPRDVYESLLRNDRRYRWLREHSLRPGITITYNSGRESAHVTELGELDSVIDTAMKGTGMDKELLETLNHIKMILTGADNIDTSRAPEERITDALAVIESKLQVLG